MPRYFFNIHDGKDVVDREGTVLKDEAQARADAVGLAGNVIAEMGGKFWDEEREWLMEVSDDTGAVLFALSFASVPVAPSREAPIRSHGAMSRITRAERTWVVTIGKRPAQLDRS
jgi:hypothetical protein